MKITFPHMGNNWVCFKAMSDYLGIDAVIPPPISRSSIEMGVENSPEFVCFPFKANIGNFIEGMRAGADTIVMAGGSRGTCRFQNYSHLQERILKDLGYQFDMAVVDTNNMAHGLFKTIRELNPANSHIRVLKAFLFMMYKARVLAEIERAKRQIMPKEASPGETNRITKQAITLLNIATSFKKIKAVQKKIRAMFNSITLKPVDVIKIGIIGEIYSVSEPALNLDIEEGLAKRGAEAHNPMSFYYWIKVLTKIGFKRGLLARNARKYLKVKTGGEDQQTIGHLIEFAKRRFDGVVCLHPFTCAPENIAKPALARISEKYHIPVLNFALDEHTSKEVMDVRIETFIDMIKRKKGIK